MNLRMQTSLSKRLMRKTKATYLFKTKSINLKRIKDKIASKANNFWKTKYPRLSNTTTISINKMSSNNKSIIYDHSNNMTPIFSNSNSDRSKQLSSTIPSKKKTLKMMMIQTMKMSSPRKTKCLPNGLRSKDKKKSFQSSSETQFFT